MSPSVLCRNGKKDNNNHIFLNKLISQITMLDENPFVPRAVTCLVHRKEKATHICTDLACQQNAILCGLCFNDARWRSQHPHEGAIRPLSDAIEWMTSIIRNQSKSIELVYERTVGSRQSQLIKFNLEKGTLLNEQLDNRLDNLRIQMQLEMELLLKEFQKLIQIEKQEFTRRIEEYKRSFYHNVEIVKRECIELLTYQNSLKYYNNFNSFTLKLIHETEKRSQDWLLQQKKVLYKVNQALQNPSFSTNVNVLLSRVNKSNCLLMPNWKGEKRDTEKERDLQMYIKNTVNSWVELPEPIDLDFPNSTKFVPHP